MKNNLKQSNILTACVTALLVAGCASSAPKSGGVTSVPGANKYRAADGRTIEVGRSTSSDGGRNFRNPHLEKCWIADGFNFKGFDVLYVAPTLSTAKIQPDEEATQAIAKENLVNELVRALRSKAIFPTVVTKESDIKAGAKVLRLENTIVDFKKGGGAARYFVGLYGGGQPVIRVVGKMISGGQTIFTFQGQRSGVSVGARMAGAFQKDEDIQLGDIRSLVLDLTDFMSTIAGEYPPAN